MNPQAVEGQIHGGIAQGLGLAVMEEIQVTDGVVRNPSFTDYLIPTILDMPPVRLDVLELADPHAPYGLRGVGRAADDLLDARGGGRHPRRHRPGPDPGPGPPRAHHRGRDAVQRRDARVAAASAGRPPWRRASVPAVRRRSSCSTPWAAGPAPAAAARSARARERRRGRRCNTCSHAGALRDDRLSGGRPNRPGAPAQPRHGALGCPRQAAPRWSRISP